MKQVELIEHKCGEDLVEKVNKRLVELADCNPSIQFIELYGNSQVEAYITYEAKEK